MGKYRERSTGWRRLKRPLIIAVAVVGFFVICNYYLGYSTTQPVIFKPPVIPQPPEVVDDGKVFDDGPNPTKKELIDSDGEKPGKTGRQPDTSVDIDDDMPPLAYTEDDPSKDPPASCRHTRNRDYEKDPVVISGRFSGRAECDIPCVGDGSPPDAVVGYRQSQCPHIKSIFFTMENSIPPQGAYDIVANTQLTSDVPLPYFSWAEYNFMNPVKPKTATAHIAAFISNCGPQRRLQWMEIMMKNGIKIHSYGNCMRNKEIPSDFTAKYGGNYNALKTAIVSQYKFTMAFENSATDDYVTEKLFGVLVAGSVPLYDGASNGKAFGPSKHSMVFANDYGTPEKLAEYLLYLDKNDTAYEEYLQWKKVGPSDDWVSLVDLANVHSNCRLCIRTADMHRKEIGPVRKGQPEGEPRPAKAKALELHVRERGKFWLRNIYLTAKTLTQLKDKIVEYVPHDKDSYLHSIQDLWTREQIKTDADVARLTPKTELEAVFVVPQHWEDKNLMW